GADDGPRRHGAGVCRRGKGVTVNTPSKVTSEHLRRHAYLYIRQSSLQQVNDHRESTARQYDLKRRAQSLGWRSEQIIVVDEDLGLSGASAVARSGFQR